MRLNSEIGNVSNSSIVYSYSEPIPFKVFMPATIEPGKRYPVLYLLHGQSQTEEIWFQSGLVEKMNTLIQQEQIEPMIIVMPREENFLQALDESRFDEVIVTELMPMIENKFPVSTNRASTAIGGISRGAVWAEKLAFNYYELFGVLGVHSLPDSIFSDYKIYTTKRDLSELFPYLKIRIDIGMNDQYRKGAERFASQLEKCDYPYEFALNPGTHNGDYWRENLSSYLVWYADNLQQNLRKAKINDGQAGKEK